MFPQRQPNVSEPTLVDLRGTRGGAPCDKMLVLALQFSRGDPDACGARESSTQRRHRRHRTEVRLLQNGREDKCVVSHEEVRSKPTNLLELGDEPTSAPTGMSRHRAIM